jgi:hypothetical protein
VPALVFGGLYDKVCNYQVLEASGFQKFGSSDKTFMTASAGHADIVIGSNAPTEVWAKVMAWMAVR